MKLLHLAAATIVSTCTLAAQTQAAQTQIDELVLANRILSNEGVLDAYGHIASVRSTSNPNHFFLSQHVPAGTVTAADIIEYDLDSKPVHDTKMVGFTERFIHSEIYKALVGREGSRSRSRAGGRHLQRDPDTTSPYRAYGCIPRRSRARL